MKNIIPNILLSLMLTLLTSASFAEPTLSKKLENKYYSELNNWVNDGGNINSLQNTVVQTCGKLVMHTVSASEKIALSTTRREDFHFRVDVCTKITVNRVHPQPEFEKEETIKIICHDSDVLLFKKLCTLSSLR